VSIRIKVYQAKNKAVSSFMSPPEQAYSLEQANAIPKISEIYFTCMDFLHGYNPGELPEDIAMMVRCALGEMENLLQIFGEIPQKLVEWTGNLKKYLI